MGLQETAEQILRERLFENPGDPYQAQQHAIDVLAETEALPRGAAVALIFRAVEEINKVA